MGWTTGREQRKDRRAAAQMSLRYRIREDSGEWDDWRRSRTTNISSHGLAFVSSLVIPITARLSLDVTLPGSAGALAAEGSLVRIARELPDDSGFEYGVELDMAAVSDVGKLEAFVRSIDAFPLLEMMTRRGASHMHLTPYSPPMLRIHGQLEPAEGEALSPHAVETLVSSLINPERRRELTHQGETHFSFMMPETGRWRVSAYRQRGQIEAVFHAIGRQVPSLYDLDLPESVLGLLQEEGGLVLVAGGLRSGKSTTLAALVDAINVRGGRVITTLEDPIEFIHENEKGIVKQREAGSDTPSISQGIRHILRQDADVLVIDAPLDAEALDLALHAAETGRLVILSVCASGIVNALDLLGALYPPERRGQAMRRLARPLGAAWCQILLPTQGRELVLAAEFLCVNAAVRNAVAQDHLDLIPGILNNTPGCATLDSGLRRLMSRGLIDLDTAVRVARFPDDFQAPIGTGRGR